MCRWCGVVRIHHKLVGHPNHMFQLIFFRLLSNQIYIVGCDGNFERMHIQQQLKMLPFRVELEPIALLAEPIRDE